MDVSEKEDSEQKMSSNRGVDMSTYCDYALRFEILVHGFPLDPSRALYYMLVGFLHTYHTIHPTSIFLSV